MNQGCNHQSTCMPQLQPFMFICSGIQDIYKLAARFTDDILLDLVRLFGILNPLSLVFTLQVCYILPAIYYIA